MAIPEWAKKELRSAFVRASRAGRRAAKTEPRAARATYRARGDVIRIELTNGAVITLPVKLIPDLKRAARSDVRSVEVLGRGSGLHWESLDLDQCPWPGVVGVCRTRMDGGIRSRRRPAIIGGQSSCSAKKWQERRPSAYSMILYLHCKYRLINWTYGPRL
ncbi:MAG: DUF2442 domain-containing protein [Steroidobacteraceae bacterium]